MTRSNVNRIKIVVVSTLLVVGLMANSARADHYNYIAPLATFVLLNSLLRHDHGYRYGGHHYGKIKRRHGDYHGSYRRGHSYSRDGYSYKSKRFYSKRKYKH